jgi:two-component system sensor histidine kinase RegB
MMMSSPDALSSTLVIRNQINLYWLIRLRWAAIVGQLVTVLGTYFVLGIEIPLWPLLDLIGLVGLTNITCAVWYRYSIKRRPEAIQGPSGEVILGGILALDLILLTAMLFCSGGPANPFSVFYLVGISLSASVLKARWTWGLSALAVVCFALLFVSHIPVAALEHHGGHESHNHHDDSGRAAEEPMALHLRGMLVAFAGATVFVAYFVTRIRVELDLRTAQLAEAERRRAAADRLDSVITMAAGAAHELATPLASIAVAVHELEVRSLEDLPTTESQDDIRTIRQEVEKCREILGSLAAQAGENRGEAPTRKSIDALIREALSGLDGATRVRRSGENGDANELICVPQKAFVQSLRSLIKNALEATAPSGEVEVAAHRRPGGIEVLITDRGTGIPESIMRRIGEPFVTSKPAGAGLGLGIFVARRVIEQSGGMIEFRSPNGQGTTVSITLPRLIVYRHQD